MSAMTTNPLSMSSSSASSSSSSITWEARPSIHRSSSSRCVDRVNKSHYPTDLKSSKARGSRAFLRKFMGRLTRRHKKSGANNAPLSETLMNKFASESSYQSSESSSDSASTTSLLDRDLQSIAVLLQSAPSTASTSSEISVKDFLDETPAKRPIYDMVVADPVDIKVTCLPTPPFESTDYRLMLVREPSPFALPCISDAVPRTPPSTPSDTSTAFEDLAFEDIIPEVIVPQVIITPATPNLTPDEQSDEAIEIDDWEDWEDSIRMHHMPVIPKDILSLFWIHLCMMLFDYEMEDIAADGFFEVSLAAKAFIVFLWIFTPCAFLWMLYAWLPMIYV